VLYLLIQHMQVSRPLKINNDLFFLFCIYRFPNDNKDIFINYLELILSCLSGKNVNIFCGDINIDIMKHSKISNDYLLIITLELLFSNLY